MFNFFKRLLDRSDQLAVNDVHSLLNACRVSRIAHPSTLAELTTEIKALAAGKQSAAICGSRHAMGGQQFASNSALIDMRRLNRMLHLDTERGLVTAEAGIEWPDLVAHLHRVQRGTPELWTIPTKQTGADKLTLGGAISANAHGRGLARQPIGHDIDSMRLISPSGDLIECSRTLNAEIFSLALGGYGLFGPIYSLTMKLEQRHKLQRMVEVVTADGLMDAFEARIADGFTLGDWQFAIDETSEEFLNQGVFSCYRPVDLETPIPSGQKKVPMRAWNELVYLAHTEKQRAFKIYADYYLASTGQVYWSDTSQLGGYDEGYHAVLDRRLGASHPASEMITELYVPRDRFEEFMKAAAGVIRSHQASVIYGTVRLIEKDEDSFLPWAKDRYACIIFNLHVDHTPSKIAAAACAFQSLIDIAIERNGSFYLTYHRWASAEQVEACYPRFREFLSKKAAYDPDERFASDWYRHHKCLFEAQYGG